MTQRMAALPRNARREITYHFSWYMHGTVLRAVGVVLIRGGGRRQKMLHSAWQEASSAG